MNKIKPNNKTKISHKFLERRKTVSSGIAGGENMKLKVKDTKDAIREISKKQEKALLNIISENMTQNDLKLSRSSEQVASTKQRFSQF